MLCNLCPRKCNIDRDITRGFCNEGNTLRVARIAPHYFEEPPISGRNGSGTVFFSGCSLKCIFCQNRDISGNDGIGYAIDGRQLEYEILKLQESGVHNINLVTPTHFVHLLIPILERLKSGDGLKIPIVYNTSGYERPETLKALDGLIDIYLPDFKYYSPELAARYSGASDYPDVASAAVLEMLRQRKKYRFSPNGLIESGVIIRHLVLPSHRADSISVIQHLASILNPDDILISIMSQYTPEFAKGTAYTNLHRKITSFEYSSVVKTAEQLGFDGFIQERASASTNYTPDFKSR